MDLSKFFNHDFDKDKFRLYDNSGSEIYCEYPNGYWYSIVFNSNGDEIHSEYSYDYWYKSIFNSDGDEIYYEDLDGILFDNRFK